MIESSLVQWVVGLNDCKGMCDMWGGYRTFLTSFSCPARRKFTLPNMSHHHRMMGAPWSVGVYGCLHVSERMFRTRCVCQWLHVSVCGWLDICFLCLFVHRFWLSSICLNYVCMFWGRSYEIVFVWVSLFRYESLNQCLLEFFSQWCGVSMGISVKLRTLI